MKIQEQNEQRMVIVSSLGQRLGWVVLLTFGVPIFAVVTAINGVAGVVSIISWGIFVLASPQGRTVVLDKLTSNISIKERHFLVINKERVIPFDDVNKVLATEKTIFFFFNVFTFSENFFALLRERFFNPWRMYYKVWELNLTVGEKQVKVDVTPNRSDMRDLANEMSSFIRKP